jgi:hypothetical protein
MSLLDPVSREEVDSGGWMLAVFAIAGMLLPMVFWGRFFLTPDAVVYSIAAALMLGAAAGGLMHRRTRRMLQRGLHPHFSTRFPPPAGNVFSLYLGMILLTWAWVVIFLAVLSALRTPTAERVFTIVDTRHCTRKCVACFVQMRLLDWPGLTIARVCGDKLHDVAMGTRVVVRGKFEGAVIYVEGVRGAQGR